MDLCHKKMVLESLNTPLLLSLETHSWVTQNMFTREKFALIWDTRSWTAFILKLLPDSEEDTQIHQIFVCKSNLNIKTWVV